MDRYHLFETAYGHAAIAWNARGVTSFRLPGASVEESRRSLLRRLAGAVEAEPSGAVATLVEAARRYFAGERVELADVPLDLGRQEPLYEKIYDLVRGLRWGETTTYGEIAKRLGEGPEVARDVGQAMARNPIPLFVPCHRVLAAGGRIGGFSAPGGAGAKARMLEMEGSLPAQASPSIPAAQSSFGF